MTMGKVLASAVTFGKINRAPLQRLLDAGCDVTTNPLGRPLTPDEFEAYGKDADALIVGNDKVTDEVLSRCPRLKIVAKHGVGIDGIDRAAARSRGILVTNAPGANAEEVADLAFGFMLMLGRGLYQANTDTKQNRWIKPTGSSMYGKTLGIVGTGAIGAASARRAAGFGMKILCCDCVENAKVLNLGGHYAALDELLACSDYITLHLPLTQETNQLLNAERIRGMKPGAFLVNTARSQLVDYDALYEALRGGAVRGYATDVYDAEPPRHLPLYDLDNVLLSPHLGGTTVESNLRMGNTAVDNVLAALAGNPPPNPAVL